MKIIEVPSIDEAVSAAKIILNEIYQAKRIKHIAFTGGRFGESFLSSIDNNFINQETEIFQTDERLVSYDDNACIQAMIKRLLSNSNLNLETDKLNFFELDVSHDHSMHSMSNLLNKKKVSVFDLVFLSLGEDGHIAGDFRESDIFNDNRICYTDKAKKPPKKRISYTASWLLKSEHIFLAAVGKEKEKAFNDFINGRGLHSSKINNDKKIIIFKDEDFK
ncbi:MAG: hypothetical protein CBC24_01810 [Candidatus Pelagibacter sp. TMED64]|nr:hypothetical protein [Gammaproteobacteria bacterium]MAY13421.1 hypothetical protein [Euryarchaeota archaeon]OUU67155.1 MAG: hypothetical protein CBC24_01810 [Candidatus Pelagibacter sp. TMED64]|tara:strand:+ start:2210 stop:2869 length:660 start_codon:yes stop_codon:yes gene_type:complete